MSAHPTQTAPMREGDLCLVTGASGYLASWIVKALLEAGFRVRGTVRRLDDVTKTSTLQALFPTLELVEADLRQSTGWAEAVAGCRWVFHVASPQAVPSEAERTAGAIHGTEHLLRAAFAEATVEKVVLTSSEAAIAYGHPRSRTRFTEDDWSVVENLTGPDDYLLSKTLAERRAWELAADRAANPRNVPLSVINPGFIAGPSLVPWGRFSLDMLKQIAEGRMPIFPDLVAHMVDVRDCAAMHLAVMNQPATDGHRHFCFALTAPMADWATRIRTLYSKQGFAPKTRVLPTSLAWVLKFFDRRLAGIYGKLGHEERYDTLYPDVYRYRYTDADALTRASMDSMLEHGWLETKRNA